MSGIEGTNTETNNESPAPVSVEAPVPTPAPVQQAAPLPPPAPSFDPQMLAQAFTQAIQPLIPRPAPPTPIWETDEVLQDRKSLFNGVGQYYKHHQDQYHNERIEPLLQELNQIKQLLPQLLARSAENPNFSTIDTQAKEMQKEYGINYWQAYQIAQKSFNSAAKNAVTNRSVPPHLSSPDTRQSGVPDMPDSGPAEFGAIIKALRSKHGNNI